MRNIRAPLDIIRPLPAKRPHCRPLCLSKEKVSGNVSLPNLLQFTRDLAQHTRPVVPVLCDENIPYRICKMMYCEKTTGCNVRLFLRSHPILYGFRHASNFCLRQTFRSYPHEHKNDTNSCKLFQLPAKFVRNLYELRTKFVTTTFTVPICEALWGRIWYEFRTNFVRTSYKIRTIFAGHWQKSHTNTTYACTEVPTPTHISLYLHPRHKPTHTHTRRNRQQHCR